MKPTDNVQRPTAGALMDEEQSRRPVEAHGSLSPEEARELAREHKDAVAEGRARTGQADPDAGQNAHDHRGTIHPSAG